MAGRSDMKITKSEDNRRRVPSASSALVIGCMLGILQTLFLISTAKAILHYMGVKPDYDICDVTTSGFHLLVKVISTTSCMTVATSLAARLGPKPMAAFQVSLQIWLATSLLADGLAAAGQAILASAFAKKNYEKTVVAASCVLQIGVVLGLLLSFTLAAVSQFASTLFTKDFDVLRLMNISFPFIAVTQPINALAFVFDGVNYGGMGRSVGL